MTQPARLETGVLPSAASASSGTYLAEVKPGCGAQGQSVKVAIKDGTISWQHDALNSNFRWEGIIEDNGTIRASVPDHPGLTATGRYGLDKREVAMSYPQCGVVTMLIGQMQSE